MRAPRRPRRAAGTCVDLDVGPLVAVGGGARAPAYRRALADLSGRRVVVPDLEEAVAAGACVQAAAVLSGRSPDEVWASWAPGGTSRVEPDGSVDADGVRSAYDELRDGVPER